MKNKTKGILMLSPLCICAITALILGLIYFTLPVITVIIFVSIVVLAGMGLNELEKGDTIGRRRR